MTAKRRHTSRSEPTELESHPDSLIEPAVRELAEGYRSGRTSEDEPIDVTSQPLPRDLLPFVQSLSLAKLVQILARRPYLYWHPVVSVQLMSLRRLVWDEGEWRRLGWQHQEGDGDGDGEFYPPKEVALAYAYLSAVLEAHAHGLFPGRRIKWTAAPRKPGRKLGFTNPSPTEDAKSGQVVIGVVDYEEQKLRRGFRTRLAELKRRDAETREMYKTRIQDLVREVLDANRIGEWSALTELVVKEHTHDNRKVRLGPGTRVRFSICLACIPERRWTKPFSLDDSVISALRSGNARRLGQAGKEGKAAYLAYAVLGNLLNQRPEIVRSRLDRFRRARRRRSAR